MSNPHGKLNENQKTIVVAMLACYYTPQEVVNAVRESWDIDIRRQSVEYYDPQKVSGNGKNGLGRKWSDLFWATREAFLKDTTQHLMANKAWRLGMLERIFNKSIKVGNMDMAMRALEQGAKDDGDVFTNRQRIDQNVNVKSGVLQVPILPTKDEWMKAAVEQHVSGTEPTATGEPQHN